MALGKRIGDVLAELEMDQTALAAKIEGLSQQNLNNLITRDSRTSEFAIRIADALGVSIRWLLDGAGAPTDRDWPFPRVDRARWDALDAAERGYVESAMNTALKECEAARSRSPGASDEKRYGTDG